MSTFYLPLKLILSVFDMSHRFSYTAQALKCRYPFYILPIHTLMCRIYFQNSYRSVVKCVHTNQSLFLYTFQPECTVPHYILVHHWTVHVCTLYNRYPMILASSLCTVHLYGVVQKIMITIYYCLIYLISDKIFH